MRKARALSIRPAITCLLVAGLACSSSGPGLFPYLKPAGGREGGTTFAALDGGLVRAIDRSQGPRKERPAAPPIALTTSDGAGLVLARLEVDAVVTGPLALTQLHLVFTNPEPRQREGRFAITLPPDAAISRFAMRNEEWREAEIVTRQRARQVYETHLRRRVDPALLEKGAGNTFSARVFPIPPSAEKELVLTYSQEVSAATPYQVPLAGLPAVGAMRWSITVDGVTRTGELRDRAPTDLAADQPGAGAATNQALTAGEAFVARVVPPVRPGRDPLGAAVILVDTSGSTAAILRRQAAAVRAVVTAIAIGSPWASIDVRAFDQAVEPLVAAPAGSLDVDELERAIVARGGLGASDLGLALAAVRADGRRLILVTDGVATVGERTAAGLAERARATNAARIDTITVGGAQDRDALAALAAAGARGGGVLDGDDPAAFARLEQTMLADVAVSVGGARDVWPATLRGLAAGQPVVVSGRRAGDPDAPLAIRFTVGDEAGVVEVAAAPGPAPLVERAVGRADVARLTAALATATTPADRIELRAAIEARGLAHRLVTSETSLLVLETEDDYARFCIDRRGLTGLLAVRHGAIEVVERGAAAPAARRCDEAAPPPPTAPGAPAAPPPPRTAATLGRSATTGAVAGVLTDRRTRAPLIGATVVVSGAHVSGQLAEITDERGWYGIGDIPAGRATLTVYYDGASFTRPIAITAGEVLDLGGAGRAAAAVAIDTRPAAAERIELDDRAPVVDQGSTRTGVTISEDVARNVPVPGRSFEATLATAAGAQGDSDGVSFAGASSLENEYVVDGLAIDVQPSRGEVIAIQGRAPLIDTTSTRQGVTITRGGSVDMASTAIGLVGPGDRTRADEPPPEPPPPPPYEGRMLTVMEHLRAGRRGPALQEALAWYLGEPTELAAILALGEALEAEGALGLAARAYGTILDRYPDRVELVRYAGERLDRLGPGARARALDAYQQAVADRPDHATGYRLMAMAQVRAGLLDDALESLERGLGHAQSDGVRAIIRGDLGLVGAALAARDPAARAVLAARLERRGVTIAAAPSVRFVLHWETDTNDVDLHVRDRAGHHAFYRQHTLPSGGELLEDVTTGYGPEAFVIPGRPIAGPYRLSALYYSRGAMGVGLGTVQIVTHDGNGRISIDDRPFLLQIDRAEVDLGRYAPQPEPRADATIVEP
jgi:hypothetical protein